MTHTTQLLVEAHEDVKVIDKKTGARQQLVAQLECLNIPTVRVSSIPVDVMWLVDNKPCMFDLKQPVDVIASAIDGRLHTQLASMEGYKCLVYGLLISGIDSEDDVTVGYGSHAWPIERYDNLLLSLQCEGAKIVRSQSIHRTAKRLADLYNWTAKAEHTSWRNPIRPSYSLQRLYGDKQYRATVESLMALFPGCGEQRANKLLDRYTVAEVLGTTREGIEGAKERWGAISGIGKKLADSWETILTGDYRAIDRAV